VEAPILTRARLPRAAAVVAALTVAGLPAAPAAAAVTCSVAGTTLSVTMSEAEDAASVVRVGTEIEVRAGTPATAVPCGGSPEVDTVDTVTVSDTSNGTTTFTIDLSGGPFEPGATTAGEGTSPEIEFQVNLGGQFPDRLIVVGTGGADDVVFSGAGINLNGGETPTVDTDVTPSGVEEFEVLAGAGPDTVSGNPTFGGAFGSKLILRGQEGIDDLTGGTGPDELFGGPGADVLDGVGGADRVSGEGDTDVLDGGAGGDDLFGGGGIDALDGEAGEDRLDGGDGADLEEGGLDDDAFDQGPAANGADVLDGNLGLDVASYDLRTANLLVTVGAPGGDGQLGEGDDVQATVEAVIGGSGDDTLVGAAVEDDVLRGGPGGDTLQGGTGDDTLDGDAGNDNLNGQGGEDSASFFGAPPVNANLLTGQSSGDGTDTLTGLENADGGSHGDTLIGDAAANVLAGRGGGDVLSGGAEDDDLVGGDGADTASYAGAPVPVTANLRLGTASGEGADSLRGLENLFGGPAGDSLAGNDGSNLVVGNGGNDSILGYDGDDDLRGSAGDDGIEGNGGADTIAGGEGRDTQSGVSGADVFVEGEQRGANGSDVIVGGSGSDLLTYGGRARGVRVTVGGRGGDGAKGEGDQVASDVEKVRGTKRRDALTANGGNDTLIGIGGNDLLQGKGGIDRLLGGAGNDRLEGGPGNDVCRGGAGRNVLKDCGKQQRRRR
jgi:Ca2+-binding RTX toxin-like protein